MNSLPGQKCLTSIRGSVCVHSVRRIRRHSEPVQRYVSRANHAESLRAFRFGATVAEGFFLYSKFRLGCASFCRSACKQRQHTVPIRIASMDCSDKTLTCRACGSPFVWTIGEQQFFKAKQLINIPGRCPRCRSARKAQLGLPDRIQAEVNCAECNRPTTVPFVPRNGNPVYCSHCFIRIKEARALQVPGTDDQVGATVIPT